MWAVSPVSVWAELPLLLNVTVKLTEELGHKELGPTKSTLVILISLAWADSFEIDKTKNKIVTNMPNLEKILFTILFWW